MKSSCFADQTYCFFSVPHAVAVVVAKADIVGDNKRRSNKGNEAFRRKGYHQNREKTLWHFSSHKESEKAFEFLTRRNP